MDYIRQCFSANLRIRRAILRLSQEDLADLAEVSAGYIANIETGRNFPSTAVFLRLSGALGVEPWKLLLDPQKDEIAYTKEEVSDIFDRAKRFILEELPSGYTKPRKLLDYGEEE